MLPLPVDEIAGLVDLEAGTVAGRAFSDDAVYDLELERVFARSWVYLCDPDELSETGQFVSTFTGEDPVAVVRQEDRTVKAMLNSCRHRGLPVCGLAGQAVALTCGYHGWRYALDGRLVGVIDGDDEFRRWAEERSLALVPVTQTLMLGGLLFGSWDDNTEHCVADQDSLEALVSSLRCAGPLRRHRRPVQLDANWKSVVEVLGAITDTEDGAMVFPSFAVLPDSGLVAAVHPKGPSRSEVWISTATTMPGDAVEDLRVAIETGLEPKGPRTVSLSLKSRVTAPEGCAVEEMPAAMPPRHIETRSATHLYRSWVEQMIDDSPLTGLLAT